MFNKVELLSDALEILSENHCKLLDVLIEKDSGEVRKMIEGHLCRNQDLIENIVKDFRELSLDYVAPLPDGYCEYPSDEDDDDDDDDDEPISKVTMKMTERG
jgi:hypothetical protein